MPSSYNPPSGGGNGAFDALPIWEFQDSSDGVPADGYFTANNAVPQSASHIRISATANGVGYGQFFNLMAVYGFMYLKQASGPIIGYQISGITDGGSYFEFLVSNYDGTTGAWGAADTDYQFQFPLSNPSNVAFPHPSAQIGSIPKFSNDAPPFEFEQGPQASDVDTAITNSPTADQKAALDGAAMPSAGNVFLTDGADISGTMGVNSDTASSIAATNLPADTGWTANQSGGDKTVAVQDYDSTTLDGMTSALNLVLAGFGTAIAQLADQMDAVTKKMQAIEAVLAAQKRPNA